MKAEGTPSSLISHHIFLFPFKWDFFHKEGLSEKFSPSQTSNRGKPDDYLGINKLKKALPDNAEFSWKYNPFSIVKRGDDQKDFISSGSYNEYVYFYPHVRKAIYNTNREFRADSLSYSFRCEWKKKKTLYYNIYIESYSGLTTYSLVVDEISLGLFKTGIGILQFNLENRDYEDREDILTINQYGRRIYPQFLGDFNGVPEERGILKTRKVLLPRLIDISSEKATVEIPSHGNFDLGYYHNEHHFNTDNHQAVYVLPGFIRQLLGNRFKTRFTDLGKGDFLLTPVIDDRMFVICAFGDERYHFSDRVRLTTPDDFWQRFVFVDDQNKGSACEEFEKKLIIDHTYNRWLEGGTAYGISRYSFMVWCRGSLDIGIPQLILDHCKTVYYHMINLALVQRATIIRFSEEIAYISNLTQKQPQKIESLYKDYIRFGNQLYFNEVTPQEQGIDIYDMIRRHMRIDPGIADLRNEINELHQYAELISERNRSEKTDTLTVIAALFLIPTFITGFFGMNIFESEFFSKYRPESISPVPVSFLQSAYTASIVYYSLFGMILSGIVFFVYKKSKWFYSGLKSIYRLISRILFKRSDYG